MKKPDLNELTNILEMVQDRMVRENDAKSMFDKIAVSTGLDRARDAGMELKEKYPNHLHFLGELFQSLFSAGDEYLGFIDNFLQCDCPESVRKWSIEYIEAHFATKVRAIGEKVEAEIKEEQEEKNKEAVNA